MGRCDETAGKEACSLRKRKYGWLILLAGLALALLTGCTAPQPKQVGTRSMPSTANLIADMAFEMEVDANDNQLGAGTAAAATYLVKNRSTPSLTNQEDNGELAARMREESETIKYNRYSAPTTAGVTRMSRLFLYPGDWPEDEVARSVLMVLQEMQAAANLVPQSRQVVIDSYYTYTYSYSVSVQQVYGDQNTAWVVGVGIDQTAKEEHKT